MIRRRCTRPSWWSIRRKRRRVAWQASVGARRRCSSYIRSMAKRAPTRSDHLRSAVAQEAARLMAEHGINDYLVAKRKAAERYGVVEGAFLPKNTEIEAALASYQRLFGGQQHASNLQRQREVALQAMRLLQKFEPRLV